jgi:ribosomal protein S12 methylthiotransferase accessory factor YcaO
MAGTFLIRVRVSDKNLTEVEQAILEAMAKFEKEGSPTKIWRAPKRARKPIFITALPAS